MEKEIKMLEVLFPSDEQLIEEGIIPESELEEERDSPTEDEKNGQY